MARKYSDVLCGPGSCTHEAERRREHVLGAGSAAADPQIWYVLTAVEAACPECGCEEMHHSRPRSLGERIRRRLTGLVPVRCHACGWRGWRPPLTHPATRSQKEDPELAGSELNRDKP